ncbi:MAG: hypothetical protein ACI9VI_001661 [Candidatus Azotimanducaceae bacterium]|jgi:hypothetical protein
MLKMTALLTLLIFIGTNAAHASYEDNTLGANRTISNELVKSKTNADTAKILLSTPYKGFYEVSGKAKGKVINFKRVISKNSYPDARWNSVAASLAGLVQLPATSTGSRMKPKATAYVVLYDNDIQGIDRSDAIQVETSAGSVPNTLAVLVIKTFSSSYSKRSEGTSSGMAGETGSDFYLIELAL